YNVPTASAPYAVLWLSSFFDSTAATLLKHIGVERRYDTKMFREVLGIQPRDARDTVIEMAYALIESGLVKKTDKYRGPGGPEERQRYMDLKL
ncbi:hypothetical protein BaRGS_00029762, partial [Batillaria attramentaria]